MAPKKKRILSESPLQLAAAAKKSTVTLTRVVTFEDQYYGEVKITRAKLDSMVKNFAADVFGQKISIDVAHNHSNGAAGHIEKLFIEDDRLRAEVAWTQFGVEAIQNRGFSYLSIEFHENYKNPETGKKHGCTLLGAGLTVRPRVKNLDPVQLAENPGCTGPYCSVTPNLLKTLSEENQEVMEKYLKELRKNLEALKLSEDAIKNYLAAFEQAAKQLSDDDAALAAMVKQLSETADSLSQAGPGAAPPVIQLSVTPAAKPANDDNAIAELLERKLAERDEKAKQLAESLESKKAQFAKLLADAEGLSDATKKELAESANLITAATSDDQVVALAEQSIKFGEKLEAAAKLAEMGFSNNAQGSVQISIDDSAGIAKLQEETDRRLGLSAMSESRRYAATGGALLEENKLYAEKVLAQFDQAHAAQLDREHKQLAGGDGVISDVATPAIWERTVARESIYRLVGMQFVQADTVPYATSINLPYSYRDTTAAGRNDTRRYEGQGIGRAGVIQTYETAYPIPQKLAFEVSDELRYLTGAGHFSNFEIVSENTNNATRIITEDSEQLIFNEVVHSADEYGAVAVVGEDLELQADGTNKVFPLAYFPVVRPRKVFDLKGVQIGNTVNPVTVTYDSVVREEYDGSGAQAAGIYYVLNYNLGEIYLVDEAGAIQTPADATPYTISYSRATNGAKFDTDLGTDEAEVHWDAFLHVYGLRKADLEDNRYHLPNFGLMSGTVRTQVGQAKKFAANFKRPGTGLSADGNLGVINDIPNFKTSAPGLWMADQRIIIGERGITRLRNMKSWSMGQLENQKDANGRFTGKKEAYGDQYIVLHTPTQLKKSATTITLYSATARVARVNP